MGLFNRKKALAPATLPPLRPPARFPLDMPLIGYTGRDVLTLRQACRGIHIFGSTGAGKSSSSGETIARECLKAGFGFLVLCVKVDEAARWKRLCAETGRAESLLVFDDSGRHRLNFLDYALHVGGPDGVHDLVEMFTHLLLATQGRGKNAGGGENPFWRDSVRLLLSYSFTLLNAAWGRVTLASLLELIDSAATRPDQVNSPAYRETFVFGSLAKMATDPVHPLSEADARQIDRFFNKRWPAYDERTRSNIVATLTSMIHPFTLGRLRELFATHTTAIPELCEQGAVVVIDISLHKYGASALVAQHIWKYCYQRAMQRRDPSNTRPVVLWADESQLLVSDYDAEYQSTARGARGITVYISQSINAYLNAIGGSEAMATTKALLANFQTLVFHQNTDEDTNRFAAEIIGRVWQWVENVGESGGTSISESRQFGRSAGTSHSSTDGKMSVSSQSGSSYSRSVSASRNEGWTRGRSAQVEYDLLPSAFSRLREAGLRDAHGRPLPPQAIVIQGGQVFSTGRNYLLCEVPQRGGGG